MGGEKEENGMQNGLGRTKPSKTRMCPFDAKYMFFVDAMQDKIVLHEHASYIACNKGWQIVAIPLCKISSQTTNWFEAINHLLY